MALSAVPAGILLAAGSGSRFGSDKLLHRLDGGTFMAVVAARRLQRACERTLAVLRPGSDRLAQALAAEGIEVVIGHESAAGMGHSLAAGVRAAANAAGWVVALADMPFIDPASHREVATALRAGAGIAAAEYRGRRGHPVGFARHWYGPLARLGGDTGARALLAGAPDEIVLCPVDDPGVLRDVDTVADLAG